MTRGERVIAFIERYCKAPEGEHVGKPLKLASLQVDFIREVYDNPAGTRRGSLSIGAIQVPAGGQPVLFLADHPLTGGYPVIAAVARHHLPLAAQLAAGCQLRFRLVAPFAELGDAHDTLPEKPA